MVLSALPEWQEEQRTTSDNLACPYGQAMSCPEKLDRRAMSSRKMANVSQRSDSNMNGFSSCCDRVLFSATRFARLLRPARRSAEIVRSVSDLQHSTLALC